MLTTLRARWRWEETRPYYAMPASTPLKPGGGWAGVVCSCRLSCPGFPPEDLIERPAAKIVI